MSPEPANYPEDSLQDLLGFRGGGWWEEQVDGIKLERGALLWTFVPHPHVAALELEAAPPAGPPDPERARIRLTAHELGARPVVSAPVPALAQRVDERLLARRGAVRLALVVSHLHGYPPQPSEARRWMTAPLVMVAPCFDAARWPAPLVDSVRRAQHPQYLWERSPVAPHEPMIIRLDAMQPLHREDRAAVRFTGARLSGDALDLLDDWLAWFLTGSIAEDSDLYAAHRTLRELYGVASGEDG
ncbi:MAG: hypothetical protein R3A51_04215 [Nannocystaceae bacterium]